MNKYLDFLLQNPPLYWRELLVSKLLGRTEIKEFSAKQPCIFVLSTGRVGSLTLASLLSPSPVASVWHEPEPKLFSLSKSYYLFSDMVNQELWSDLFYGLRSELFSRSLSTGRGYIETSPQATFLAPLIYTLIPNSKFIHLTRHPHEVIVSGMRRGWYTGIPSDKTRITPKSSSSYSEQWELLSAFQKNVWLWAETNTYISDFIQNNQSDRFLEIQSESVFSGDLDEISKIAEFCQSEVPNVRKVRRILKKKKNKQTYGAYPSIEDWSESDVEYYKRVVGSIAKKMGYHI